MSPLERRIEDRLEGLRQLRENPTPEAARELAEAWGDDYYNASEENSR